MTCIVYMDITVPKLEHEEKFLDQFLKALNKINPSLHNSLACMKRVSIFTWILG